MADYLYGIAIQGNSVQNNMADEMVWQLNRGGLNGYSLYVFEYMRMCTCTLIHVCVHIRMFVYAHMCT